MAQPLSEGRAHYCNSANCLPGIDSQPEELGTITVGMALLKQPDNAHLRGFRITPAGAPNPVSRP